MTQQQHPITPPPELRAQWRQEAPCYRDGGVGREDWLIRSAAKWGFIQANADIKRERQEAADQELEACCEWLSEYVPYLPESEDKLRAARRQKPPSLKEQALEELDAATLRGDCFSTSPAKDIIRRALESIPDPS
jgi:hypothetical protein